MRTARTVFASLALVALAVSCGEDDGPSSVSPSSAFPPESTVSVPEPTSGGGPTGGVTTPEPGSGTLSSGEVSLQLSGDLELETTIANLVSGVVAPPPGGMAVVWTAGGTDATTVGIGGTSFTGTRPTAPELSLTIAVQTSRGISSFLSNDGGCTVTIAVVAADELAGGFTCDGLQDPTGVVVDVSASFRATG